MDCNCMACEDLRSRGQIPSPPPGNEIDSFADKEMSLEDLRLELEWARSNGITVLPNSKETRITSNTYVYLHVYIIHRTYGVLPLEPNGGGLTINGLDPQVKLTSSPDWCSKCNRDLLSYSPKTSAFSYCKLTKKVLGKFRIICSSNSHFVDKQLITITAHLRYRNWVLEKSIPNIRINSKKPRDEADPAYRKRRKRKPELELQQQQPIVPFPSIPGGIVLESLQPNSGPANGNTLVTIRGSGFTSDCDVIFGNARLRPFLQNGSTDTLLCFSINGVPGSSVQVYVKEGDRVSEPLLFHYSTGKNESEPHGEKMKIGGDNVAVQQLKELSTKYNQLESLVTNVLHQYQSANGTSGGYQSANESHMLFTMILKSVLLDILHAKNTLKEVESNLHVDNTAWNAEQMNRVGMMYDCFRGDMNKFQGIDFSNPIIRDDVAASMQRSYEAFANKKLDWFYADEEDAFKFSISKPVEGINLLNSVAGSDPFKGGLGIERRLSPVQESNLVSSFLHQFGDPLPIGIPGSPNTPVSKPAGLEKLVAAIETLETKS